MGRNGMGRNGYVPKWSWAEMAMGRNDPEPNLDVKQNQFKFYYIHILSRSISDHHLRWVGAKF